MQERHINHEQYIAEQSLTTKKYVIPYIEQSFKINTDTCVAEIGCGEGGNLKPFVDIGCKVIGIDISKGKIEKAHEFFESHHLKNNVILIESDIYNINADVFKNVDLIIMRDTLEHIPNQAIFFKHLYNIINIGTKIFIAFPPWRMPFAGHQQVCMSRFLSKLPYFHLLPHSIYKAILKMFGEPPDYINSLLDVKKTKLSINKFNYLVKQNNFKFNKKDFFFINPNYEIKFKLKPKKILACFNISWIRDFYTTTVYALIEK